MDTNKDGTITIDDFDDLFNSYRGDKMDKTLWEQLLAEADTNGDGVISFEEFEAAMGKTVKNNLNCQKRKCNKK